MAGRIIVETPQEHAAWLMRNSNPAVAEQPGYARCPPPMALATMAEVRR